MSSSAVDHGVDGARDPSVSSLRSGKDGAPLAKYSTPDNAEKGSSAEKGSPITSRESSFVAGDQTHRKLKSRHIQLIGIGGTIGTALYVQIGKGLMNGGPASLFMAFTIWYVPDYCIVLEMVTG
jgi:amino acid permease